MKTFHYFLFLFPILLICSELTYSQDFSREAGIRAGFSSGFTFRQYTNDKLSHEGLLSFRQNGLQLSLIRQIHGRELIEYSPDLYFIYGYGLHAGFIQHYYDPDVNPGIRYPYTEFSTLAGIDGFVSLEYRVNSIPLTIALDYKPFFELVSVPLFRIVLWDIGLSFKYRF